MSDAHAGLAAEATWTGGGSPFAVGHKKLGMWLFIVSDALTFGALIVAYCYVRNANDWPTPFDFFPAIIFFEHYDAGAAFQQLDDGFRSCRRGPRVTAPPRRNGRWPPRSAALSSSSCTPMSGIT